MVLIGMMFGIVQMELIGIVRQKMLLGQEGRVIHQLYLTIKSGLLAVGMVTKGMMFGIVCMGLIGIVRQRMLLGQEGGSIPQ